MMPMHARTQVDPAAGEPSTEGDRGWRSLLLYFGCALLVACYRLWWFRCVFNTLHPWSCVCASINNDRIYSLSNTAGWLGLAYTLLGIVLYKSSLQSILALST